MADGAFIAGLPSYGVALAHWRLKWIERARRSQLPPDEGSWSTWLMLCGRGWGKTRVGAEDISFYAASTPNVRCGVVAPTQGDCRSVCFEGESGLLAVIPKGLLARNGYNSTELEIRFANGSLISGKSAEKPDRLRGPQFNRVWCDEVASWQRLEETWSNIDFALRLGDDPKRVITTTPRPMQFLRDLRKHPKTITISESTFANAANLAAPALERMKDTYAGTTKGRQELFGELLDDDLGSLFTRADIDKARTRDWPPLARIVIAIDPAVTKAEASDETGIIVAGADETGEVYIMADFSGRYSPKEWASIAWDLLKRFEADAIVAETNQGGDLVEANIRAVAGDQLFRYIGVHARRGKYVRAEPVAAMYEKGRVHHVGVLATLEDQMIKWRGIGDATSPDRMDALVYAVTELTLGTKANVIW